MLASQTGASGGQTRPQGRLFPGSGMVVIMVIMPFTAAPPAPAVALAPVPPRAGMPELVFVLLLVVFVALAPPLAALLPALARAPALPLSAAAVPATPTEVEPFAAEVVLVPL
jgi:hypothetical protein